MEPSLKGLLGQYEYKDERSDKFWHISFNPMMGLYDVAWGKNGYPIPESNHITYKGAQAIKKVQEKIAKGYRLVRDENGLAVKGGLTKLEPPKLPKKPRAERAAKTEDFMTLFKKEIPDEN